MKESYTVRKDETVWDFIDKLDEKDTHEEIIEYLREGKIRSFGDGLAYLINEKDKDTNITSDNLQNYLEEKCEKNGIVLKEIASSRNTFKNWFGNTRPRKEAKNREIMFKIAFALELNIEEVKYLFHKVYFDRAFDYRNYREAVYYYCIINGYNYERANNIINAIEEKEKTLGEDRHSLSIAKAIGKVETDAELIDWICSRWVNFQYNNMTAMEIFNSLFEKAKELADKEYAEYKVDLEYREELRQKSKKRYKDYDNEGYREEDDQDGVDERIKNVCEDTIPFIYHVIFFRFSENGNNDNYMFNNSTNLHKELKSNFPDVEAFQKAYKIVNANDSKSNKKNYEELRKMIILLEFYSYFNSVPKVAETAAEVFEYGNEFIAEMNDILNECGMCELYPANPYDFLFTYCIRTKDPIDNLRAFVTEIKKLENDESE